MEVRFYDEALNFKGIMENQSSLIWTRKYFEPGEFELHAPLTVSNMALTERGNLIWLKGNQEAGIIEDRQMEESSTKRELTIKGRFLSSYMDRRLIRPTVQFDGYVELAMRQLLSGADAIPLVELGEVQGFTAEVSFQVTYKNLLTYMEKLAKSSGLGFRFRPDFRQKKIYFEVYSGMDRTSAQTANSRVIFSESYDNLNDIVFRENDQLYRNVAYVGGEGEGNERIYVQVGSGSGLSLREVFVDARDLRQEESTIAEYKEQLIQRGREALAEKQISSSFECSVEAGTNFSYRKDYDLGDIVTIQKKEWGVKENLRITEIQEVYEQERMRIVPTFGTALPSVIDWSDVS